GRVKKVVAQAVKPRGEGDDAAFSIGIIVKLPGRPGDEVEAVVRCPLPADPFEVVFRIGGPEEIVRQEKPPRWRVVAVGAGVSIVRDGRDPPGAGNPEPGAAALQVLP